MYELLRMSQVRSVSMGKSKSIPVSQFREWAEQ